jgi:hypothetical protein
MTTYTAYLPKMYLPYESDLERGYVAKEKRLRKQHEMEYHQAREYALILDEDLRKDYIYFMDAINDPDGWFFEFYTHYALYICLKYFCKRFNEFLPIRDYRFHSGIRSYHSTEAWKATLEKVRLLSIKYNPNLVNDIKIYGHHGYCHRCYKRRQFDGYCNRCSDK